MCAAGQKLFAANVGPGAIQFDRYKLVRPTIVIGEAPEVPEANFNLSDHYNLPRGWEENPIISQNMGLVEAFKYYRNYEAQLSPDYEIREGYWKPEKEIQGELPISRWEFDSGRRKWTLIIHTDFIRMWNDIRNNDVRFEYTFSDGDLAGQTRALSLAWAIFYRVAKHEMTDISSRTGFPKGIGRGHLSKGNATLHDREHLANMIDGSYGYVNDALWIWFLGSYCLPGYSTKYNNKTAKDRYLWFLGHYEGSGSKALDQNMNNEAREMELHREFPRLLSDIIRRNRAIDLAVAVNNRFYSNYKEMAVDSDSEEMRTKFIEEYRRRHPNVVHATYATGKDETGKAAVSRSLEALPGPAPEKEYVSPARLGIPQNGIFYPFHHQRSDDDWGIGDFGTDKKAVDFCSASGINFRQHLPMSWSGASNSPYSEASSRAIDLRFISIPMLVQALHAMADSHSIEMDFTDIDGFLSKNRSEIEGLRGLSNIDHDAVVRLKREALVILWRSFNGMDKNRDAKFPHGLSLTLFKDENISWLPYHMLYLILKDENIKKDMSAGWDWRTWGDLADVHSDAVQKAMQSRSDEIDFYSFIQFIADGQFAEASRYGREKDVEMAIDIPFARDGADVWLNPEVFGLKKEDGYRRPSTQGVPAEPAYPAGQYWQFYPYDWTNPKTMDYLRELFEFHQTRATIIRLDHVLGFYRAYLFTECDMTLNSLGIYDDIERIFKRAKADMKSAETLLYVVNAASLPDRVSAIKKAAAKRVYNLIHAKMRSLAMGEVDLLADDAVDLTFGQYGLRPDAMVRVRRETPEAEHGNKLPEDSLWQRMYIVEKKVFDRKPVWDSIAIAKSDDDDYDGMVEWLFNGKGPQADDNLQLAYFKQAPGEAALSEFLRLAQDKGTTLIFETLGLVPEAIKNTVPRLQGFNYLPVIWGFHAGSEYHPSRHNLHALAVFGLHDSSTLKARWEDEENELKADEKLAILKELFPQMDDTERERHVKKLTPEVHRALLGLVYNSQALMVAPTMLDLLGLGNEYRLNVPGEAADQWERRLPVEASVEKLASSAIEEPSTASADSLVALQRGMVAERHVRASAVSGQDKLIVGSDPDLSSGQIQVRLIPGNLEQSEPFLIEAYAKKNPSKNIKKVQFVAVDSSGALYRYDMKESAVKIGLPSDTIRYALQLIASKAGAYLYEIDVTYEDDGEEKLERSGRGYLFASRNKAGLNPLSSPDNYDTGYDIGTVSGKPFFRELDVASVMEPVLSGGLPDDSSSASNIGDESLNIFDVISVRIPNDGPGAEKEDIEPKTMEIASFYPFFKELNTQSIEIYIPQDIVLTSSVVSAIKSLNDRIRQRREEEGAVADDDREAIKIKKYNDSNLSKKLSENSEKSKRIFIANSSAVAAFSELVNMNRYDLFKGNRLLTASIPQGSNETEDSVHQSWLLKVAMLSCLLTEENEWNVGTALEAELNGRIDGNVEEFVTMLARIEKESTDDRTVLNRVSYFLHNVVKLSTIIAEQLRMLKAFWTAA